MNATAQAFAEDTTLQPSVLDAGWIREIQEGLGSYARLSGAQEAALLDPTRCRARAVGGLSACGGIGWPWRSRDGLFQRDPGACSAAWRHDFRGHLPPGETALPLSGPASPRLHGTHATSYQCSDSGHAPIARSYRASAQSAARSAEPRNHATASVVFSNLTLSFYICTSCPVKR